MNTLTNKNKTKQNQKVSVAWTISLWIWTIRSKEDIPPSPGSKLLTISVGCFSGLRLLLLFASQKRVQLPWGFPSATGDLVWGHSNALVILDWRCEGQKQTTHTHPNTQKNPETFWALLEGLEKKKKKPFSIYFYYFSICDIYLITSFTWA